MSGQPERYRLHEAPRISANQLAEYTLASPTRRQAIIRNAKFAPTFLTIRYSAAKAEICSYLADPSRPVAKLHKAEARLKDEAKNLPTDFQRNDALLSAEAIASFASPKSQVPSNFSKLTFEAVTGTLPKLIISGVCVSVQIDLISLNEPKGLVGAVVLQTSKAIASKTWRDEHNACVASLIWMFASENLTYRGDVDRKLCFAVDVFAQRFKEAPASYKRRLKDIEASCAEISALWSNVAPPADYAA